MYCWTGKSVSNNLSVFLTHHSCDKWFKQPPTFICKLKIEKNWKEAWQCSHLVIIWQNMARNTCLPLSELCSTMTKQRTAVFPARVWASSMATFCTWPTRAMTSGGKPDGSTPWGRRRAGGSYPANDEWRGGRGLNRRALNSPKEMTIN